MEKLFGLRDFTVEHLREPMGIDVKSPRFSWKFESNKKNVLQNAYQLQILCNGEVIADTGIVKTEKNIDNIISGWEAKPMTRYNVKLTVSDNQNQQAIAETWFETGRMGIVFQCEWIEPEQIPTPDSMKEGIASVESVNQNPYGTEERDFSEFRPAQYIRIPFETKKGIKKARVYATAHGLYKLYVNGQRPDFREFAPENTTYLKRLLYQTYDVTEYLRSGKNVLGIILADGWWSGRVGLTGDSCQYGDKIGLLFECDIEYQDGTKQIVTGEDGLSSEGPLIYSDLFVGEKYDATKEMEGWSEVGFSDETWKPVHKVSYPKDHLTGQAFPAVYTQKVMRPAAILHTPAGETLIDVGQVIAGNIELSLFAEAGIKITLEHSEVLDENGNYYNNILGKNKEQTDIYITKKGFQRYRPFFTYHGFRYVKVSGWPGTLSVNDINIYVLSTSMDTIGSFESSDERLNRLQENIWWSQVANAISIPTDCPQREKAGWTGDIMAYAPTMCFIQDANAFLSNWMSDLQLDQKEDGAVPVVVPFLRAYEEFHRQNYQTVTSCGWGDAVIVVPYAVYKAYGNIQILEENYDAMKRWMAYIEGRANNHHPKGYENWEDSRKERSRYLWNTDFHYGDWLIPSRVLGNPDGGAMLGTAYATMELVAPAYYAFSAKQMSKVANILGKADDEAFYSDLYKKIRKAFIEEYVDDDGKISGDFQGIYVIALKCGLVPENLRSRMTEHLCEMIRKNNGCLDTGFLSILFLMDVLCENGRKDVAYDLLFQTNCPSWLYEVEHGATTMWESWGAVGENGEISTYSYNHYAFGCVGEWMYREIGGLQAILPGYKKMRIAPALDCGLSYAKVSLDTSCGKAVVQWRKLDEKAVVEVELPVNTSAEICLPGINETVGSGRYLFVVDCVK